MDRHSNASRWHAAKRDGMCKNLSFWNILSEHFCSLCGYACAGRVISKSLLYLVSCITSRTSLSTETFTTLLERLTSVKQCKTLFTYSVLLLNWSFIECYIKVSPFVLFHQRLLRLQQIQPRPKSNQIFIILIYSIEFNDMITSMHALTILNLNLSILVEMLCFPP